MTTDDALREQMARTLHDAATGRIVPDADDPIPYGRMAARVYDEIVGPLAARLAQAEAERDRLAGILERLCYNQQAQTWMADEPTQEHMRGLLAERDEARADLADVKRQRSVVTGEWIDASEQRAVIARDRDAYRDERDATQRDLDLALWLQGLIKSWSWGVATQPAEPPRPGPAAQPNEHGRYDLDDVAAEFGVVLDEDDTEDDGAPAVLPAPQPDLLAEVENADVCPHRVHRDEDECDACDGALPAPQEQPRAPESFTLAELTLTPHERDLVVRSGGEQYGRVDELERALGDSSNQVIPGLERYSVGRLEILRHQLARTLRGEDRIPMPGRVSDSKEDHDA